MMRRIALALVMAAIVAGPTAAEFKVTNIKAVHGPLGPDRKDQDKIELLPGEELYFRYTAIGAGIDEMGNIKGEFLVKVTDAAGKEVLTEKSPIKGVIALGGGTFPGLARIFFGPGTPAGKYKVAVTMHDANREEKASFEREVTIKPVAFAVINPRFFYDPEGRIAAPVGGHVNQTLFFRFQLVGFDVSQKKIKTKMVLQALDKNGRETLPQPLIAGAATDKPEEVAQATVLNYNGSFALNRAGEFTLRFVFTDEMANKEVKLEFPLKVAE